MVIPSLIYGYGSWTLYRRHIKKLENFHMRALPSILGIRWQDHVTNLEVLDRAESTSIESILIKAQIRWVEHVFLMQEYRMPRRMLYGKLAHGKRHMGRPRKRYKDCIKASLRWCKIMIIIIIIIINLIYIAQFDTNGIITALYIVIRWSKTNSRNMPETDHTGVVCLLVA